MVAAGAGAGIAATFNTPLGAVLFAVELMLPGVFRPHAIPVVLATGTATQAGRLASASLRRPSWWPAMTGPSFSCPCRPKCCRFTSIRS